MTQLAVQPHVLETLGWDSVKKLLDERVLSVPGKSLASKIRPLPIDDAKRSLSLTSELKNAMIDGAAPEVAGLVFCSAPARRASKGSVMSQGEILAVRSTLICSTRMVDFFSSRGTTMPGCFAESGMLPDVRALASLLKRSFTDDGEISGDEYPQIKRIEKAILSVRQEIESRLAKMMHSSGLDQVLQEKVITTRNDRYVLLVKANMKGRLKGTVHDVSASSATLFVEPEAVAELSDEMFMRKAELVRETEKILAELSISVGAEADAISLHESFASRIDLLCGQARLARDLRCGEPVLIEDYILELYSARHPVLQAMIGNDNVPNDIVLGKNHRCILITGANTGGKTVLLKTAGLCTLMALHGMHIPASPDSRVGAFTSIMTDIGDDQSIEKSLSTFSGQIVALNDMADRSERGALILLDEIMAGTNPRYGAALAQSYLETLVSSGALVIATTHYPELRNLPASDARFINASVSFDVDTLRPSYELGMGIPGSSYTFEIARKYGTQDRILAHAQSLLSSTELSVDALLETINRTASDLDRERAVVASLRDELSSEKERYAALSKRLDDETARIRKDQTSALLEEISRMRHDAAKKTAELQNASIARAGEINAELAKMEEELKKKLHRMKEDASADRYLPFDPDRCAEGDSVFIISIEKEGVISSVDRNKKTAQIRLGTLNSRFSFDDLLLPRVQKKAPAAKPKHTVHVTPAESGIPTTIQTRYNTIDLRGLRVDEAIIRLGNDLDAMIRTGVTAAVIIHGHGTGAMKEAVRTALKSSPYVDSFRRGGQGEGGDGVTIALLFR